MSQRQVLFIFFIRVPSPLIVLSSEKYHWPSLSVSSSMYFTSFFWLPPPSHSPTKVYYSFYFLRIKYLLCGVSVSSSSSLHLGLSTALTVRTRISFLRLHRHHHRQHRGSVGYLVMPPESCRRRRVFVIFRERTKLE